MFIRFSPADRKLYRAQDGAILALDRLWLITDRTASDVNKVRDISLNIMRGTATADDLAEFNSAAMKGAYNYTDLNRVSAAMGEINRIFTEAGYFTKYKPVSGSWSELDVPTVGQMSSYLANVEELRNILSVLATTPQKPTDMDLLTWAEANDIEKILSDVYFLIRSAGKTVLKSDMAWSVSDGPDFYFMN